MYAFTVWQFKSPSTEEKAVVVKSSEPMDHYYQHSYQKILWRGMADSTKEALNHAATA